MRLARRQGLGRQVMEVKKMGRYAMSAISRGVAAAMALSVAATGGALAASTKDRVEALEATVAELTAAADASKADAARLDQLEREVRGLTGRVEELTYNLDQANAKIYSLTTALSGGAPADDASPFVGIDGRASDSQAPVGRATGAGPTSAGGNGPTMLIGSGSGEPSGDAPAGAAPIDDVQLPLDPDAAFNYANGFLFEEDLPRAEAAFSMFLSAFGAHPRAADAQFRLGEILLAEEKYAKAADAFVVFIRKHPDEAKVPEAYLKLSASFAGLGEQAEACKVLRAAKSKYAGGDPQFLDRADAAMSRTGC